MYSFVSFLIVPSFCFTNTSTGSMSAIYCAGILYLLSDTQDEEAINRLNALCSANDGFEISMMDLKQRGPGDIIGTKQSGLPTFHLGNIIEDTKILNGAKEDAKEIFDSNKYLDFKNYIQNNYKNADIV